MNEIIDTVFLVEETVGNFDPEQCDHGDLYELAHAIDKHRDLLSARALALREPAVKELQRRGWQID